MIPATPRIPHLLTVTIAKAQEAGVVAVTYAKARGLETGASSPAHLLLDPDLSDALFKARPLAG